MRKHPILTADPRAPGFAAQLEALCRALAPRDFQARHVPVVLESRLAHDFNGCEIIGVMIPRGVVKPGQAAILLRDDRMAEDAAERVARNQAFFRRAAEQGYDTSDMRPARFSDVLCRMVLEVTLHELAHVLIDGERVRPELGGWPAVIEDLREFTLSPYSGLGAPIPFLCHEGPFIRCACHLAYRAGRMGLDVGPYDILDGPTYGLTPLRHYYRTIRPEARRMAGRSFREILDTPAPPAFTRLWHEDLVDWAARRERDRARALARAETESELSTAGAVAGPTSPSPSKGANAVLKQTIAKLSQQLTRKHQTARSDYWGLVARVCENKDVDPEQLDAALQAVGRDIGQFEADCELRQERLRLRAELDRLPDLEKQEGEARATIAAAEKKLETAEKAHEAAIGPPLVQLERVAEARRTAAAARKRLIETCPYENLAARVAAIHAEIGKLDGERAEVQRDIEAREDNLREERRQLDLAERRRGVGSADDFKKSIVSAAQRLEPLRAQVENLLGKMHGLQAEETKIREELTQP